MAEIKLTEEQEDIVKSFKDADRLKINAYAGTGKTTTLMAITNAYPDKRFLVLTFNRSVAEELRQRMPSNCDVYTIHSLAFKFISRDLKKKLAGRHEFTDDIMDLLGVDVAKAIFFREVFELFCNSSYSELSEENIGRLIRSNSELRKKFRVVFGLYNLPKGARALKESKAIGEVKEAVEYLFYVIERGATRTITHDYYLKVFQLNLEDYKWFFRRYDAILVDEGQDLNGIQEFVFLHAPVSQKVIVGDTHQSIYSWRGAINTMAKLKDWETKSLTVSFRFLNDEIVETANRFLKNLKFDENEIKAVKKRKANGLKAYVARTNARLVRFLNNFNEPLRFARNLEDVFRSVRQADRLLDYYRFRDEFYLKGLPMYLKTLARNAAEESDSLDEFINYFAGIGDVEMFHALYTAKRVNVEAVYKKAKSLETPDAKSVLGTAHSVKGLEFEEVYFFDDFPDLMRQMILFIREEICSLEEFDEEKARFVVEGIREGREEFADILDEMNLQYVALTRAMKKAKGEGYKMFRENFEKKLTPKRLLEGVERVRKLEESMKSLWTELSSEEDSWSFDDLDF